jgi:hypothetical protein
MCQQKLEKIKQFNVTKADNNPLGPEGLKYV